MCSFPGGEANPLRRTCQCAGVASGWRRSKTPSPARHPSQKKRDPGSEHGAERLPESSLCLPGPPSASQPQPITLRRGLKGVQCRLNARLSGCRLLSRERCAARTAGSSCHPFACPTASVKLAVWLPNPLTWSRLGLTEFPGTVSQAPRRRRLSKGGAKSPERPYFPCKPEGRPWWAGKKEPPHVPVTLESKGSPSPFSFQSFLPHH